MSEEDQKRSNLENTKDQINKALPMDQKSKESKSLTAEAAEAITGYLSGFEQNRTLQMQALRDLIHEFEPDIREAFSYGMPTFKYKKKTVFHFAAAKNHLGIYPGTEAVAAFGELLKGYTCTKGSIHLGWAEQLPEKLIHSILQYNIEGIK